MKDAWLIWAGLLRHPGRTLLILLSLANGFLLFGVMMAIQGGLAAAAKGSNAEVLYVFNAIARGDPLPLGLRTDIEAVPGVRLVMPTVPGRATYGANPEAFRVFAVDPQMLPDSMPAMRAKPSDLKRFQAARQGALVEERLASAMGWSIGERVPLKAPNWLNRDGTATWPVIVVGTFRAHQSQLLEGSVVFQYPYLDEGRVHRRGTASAFIVRVDDAARAPEIARQIDLISANSDHPTRTAPASERARSLVSDIGDVDLVVRAVGGAMLFSLFVSVGATLVQSGQERRRAFAVLKTLGFSNARICRIVFSESTALVLLAATVGLSLAHIIFPLFARAAGFPSLEPGPFLAVGVGLALAVGLLAGLPAALAALKTRLVELRA